MPRRLQLVVNPAAGGGRASRLLPDVRQALLDGGHDLRVTPTTSLEHAGSLVAEAVADDRLVVAMGGDGLLGRVATAVADDGGLLAPLPGGRGNDFCRRIGLPRDPVAAWRVLQTGREAPVDLGVVESTAGRTGFLGIASVGFDSAVQERTLVSRLPLGQLVYAYAALATVAGWRHATFTGAVDGVPLQLHGWTVAVCNSGTYGGGMRLAPQARLDDGLLDVVTIGATSRRTFLAALPQVFRGTHVHRPQIAVRPARTVHLAADRPFRVFADGDPVGSLPCTVSVRPAAVRMLLPS